MKKRIDPDHEYRQRFTDWLPCKGCGATTRHDFGICIRHPDHPRFDPNNHSPMPSRGAHNHPRSTA